MLSVLLWSGVAVLASVASLWLLSIAIRDASIVDIFWGTGFVIVAWVSHVVGDGGPRSLLVAALTSAWGLRLSGYLAWRNLGKGEDYRYQAMRKHHGPRFAWISLFTVFLFQGVLILLVSLPITAVAHAGGPALGAFDVAAASVFAVGLVFETVGDYQLARFKARPDNKGKVMNRGLWRYTRHPNYFGDFVVWWGLFGFAAIVSAYWAAVGPLAMSFLLIRVSGVAMLEKTIGKRRPGYAEYIAETSAFFPWPPKRGAQTQPR